MANSLKGGKLLHKIINHFITRVVRDQRGQIDWGGLLGGGATGFAAGGAFGGPVGAGVGALIGGGLGAFAGGGERRDDPLAGVRQQLQALAAEVPGITARRKELIGELFGEAREAGLEDIGEEVRGRRGFGAASIEPEMRTELLRKLALGQSEAELMADIEGLKMRRSIYGDVGGITPTEFEPTFGEEMLGFGGELLGQELRAGRLKGLFKKTGVEEPELKKEVARRPGAIIRGI